MTVALIDAVNKKNITEIEQILVADPSCINLMDGAGATAIMHASQNADADCLSILLKYAAIEKIDINRATPNGMMNSLLFAANAGSEKCLRMLLDYEDINPNFTNRNGFTALMLAARKGDIACVELLAPMSDLTLQDSMQKKTALDWATDDAIKDLLVSLDNRNDPMKGF